ncbi:MULTISPECIES: glutaminase A [Aerosakkonema]|uniref:glutaminase A n=1 Tax=Aerosakkonema TaxID=1246629 RepID=UPI0035BA5C1A
MAEKHDLKSLASAIQSFASSSPFLSYLTELYEKYESVNEGTVANYIPELGKALPEWFGICVATVNGQVFEVGNCNQLFTMESISKAFVYGLALEDYGREYLNSKVTVKPIKETLNNIALDEKSKRPYNPLVNAGAIATTDLIKGNGVGARLKRILDMFERYTGRKHDIYMPAFVSDKAYGNRHRAIAYLMLNFGIISDKIDETLDLYFHQSAIQVNARDLGVMAATLANGGVNPITGERAIDERYVQDVVSVMQTCGMYDSAVEWAYRVGIPAVSGISGGITAVVPGKLGLGVFSPPVDEGGNSIRGMKVCEEISQDFGLHLFNVAQPKHNLKDLIESGESVDDW